MESAHVIDALPDLFSAGLSPVTEAQIRQHLSTCLECRQIYAHYEQDQRLLDRFLQTAPYLPVADRLSSKSSVHTSTTSLPTNTRKPAPKNLSLAPFALVLLVALAAGAVTLSSIMALDRQQDPMATGGLGMTKTEWEKSHKFLQYTGSYVYSTPANPDGRYNVSFWDEGDQIGQISDDAPIWLIGVSVDTLLKDVPQTSLNPDEQIDIEKMRRAARTLLPLDAELREAKGQVDRHNIFAEIYHSKSLESRYRPLPSVPDPWASEPPGTIIVNYISGSIRSGASILIKAATLYPPSPPAPPTPIPDYTPPPPPLPTQPYPSVPTPEQTISPLQSYIDKATPPSYNVITS